MCKTIKITNIFKCGHTTKGSEAEKEKCVPPCEKSTVDHQGWNKKGICPACQEAKKEGKPPPKKGYGRIG